MDQSARAREERRQALRAAVVRHWPQLRRLLSEREATVLALRLGIVSDVPLTQEQIARRLHLATGSVPTIEKRALAKVRAALGIPEASGGSCRAVSTPPAVRSGAVGASRVTAP